MKKFIASIGIGLILSIVTTQFSNVTEDYMQYSSLHENVLRLHVIANSDSEYDQAIKLEVKDKIVDISSELFTGSLSIEQTKSIAVDNIEDITKVVTEVISENGEVYPVEISVKELDFPVKQYEDITMPSGVYSSLNVEIGEAKGKNWWCVLYPSMCIPVATSADTDKSETNDNINPQADTDTIDGISPEQEEMLKQPQKYKVKFALFELYEILVGKKDGVKSYGNH